MYKSHFCGQGKMSNFTLLFAGFLYFVFTCESMLIMNMMVPSHVEQGSDVTLYCFYNLESDFSLYSIKWYKDSQEFFDYINHNNLTRFTVSSQSNLIIQYDERDKGTVVHLKEVKREAEGRYMCEITIETPIFYTDHREANLAIYEISSPGPLLIGHPKNNLKNGDQLRYTCSFRKSKPKPILSWFVDNKEIAGKLMMEFPSPMDLTINETEVQWNSGSTMEWWSIESDLSIWPSAAQVEEGICIVSCRIIVLNESIYKRIASITTTSATFRKILSANHSSDSQISVLDKENSRSAKGFIRIEVFLFVFGLVAAVIALHGLVLQPIIYRE